MNSDKGESKRKGWESPVIITVLTAIVGIIGTGAGAVFQGYYEAALEKQKFESNLIFKALEPEDAKERAKYLLFLADAGLINSLDVNKIRKIAEDPESIPSSNPALKLESAKDILSISSSVPGEIVINDNNVWNTWSDNNIVYAASRLYGKNKGRVIVFGHDDILKPKGNENDLKESFKWLSGLSKNRVVAFSAGHCEWMPTRYPKDAEALYKSINAWGYDIVKIENRITKKSLEGVGVLVLGNSWGSISDPEIEAIEKFVSNGGGLFAAGLGWSWIEYGHKDTHKCTGNTEGQIARDLTTYPMNRVMERFGARWTGTYIQK